MLVDLDQATSELTAKVSVCCVSPTQSELINAKARECFDCSKFETLGCSLVLGSRSITIAGLYHMTVSPINCSFASIIINYHTLSPWTTALVC